MNNPFSNVKDLIALQREAKEMEKKMKEQRFHGKSKKDLVEVVVDGTQSIISLSIDDMLLSPQMKESLVGQLKEALTDAQKALQKSMASSMDMDKLKSMFGGLTK